MRRIHIPVLVAFTAAVAVAAPVSAQHATHGAHQPPTHLVHIFPDGGSIEVQSTVADSTVAHFRVHLQEIAQAFRAGEAAAPAIAHVQCMPGGAALLGKRSAITLAYRELPRGGELRITTRDADALRVVHEFLELQRDHHAGSAGAHSAAAHSAHHSSSQACARGHHGGM